MTSGDLERFHQAFRRIEHQLKTASRSNRFKPPTDLATARLSFDDDGGQKELVGEILDLSADGMKVAIQTGYSLNMDQRCQVTLGDDSGDTYSLIANVRWVESSAYITVFGVSLESSAPNPHT